MLGAAAIIYNYCWLAITTIIAIIAIVNIIASTTAIATTEIKLLTFSPERIRHEHVQQQRMRGEVQKHINNTKHQQWWQRKMKRAHNDDLCWLVLTFLWASAVYGALDFSWECSPPGLVLGWGLGPSPSSPPPHESGWGAGLHRY